MSHQQVSMTLLIHACPKAAVEQVTYLLPTKPVWHPQNLVLGFMRTELDLKLSRMAAEDLIAALNRVGNLHADITLISRNSSCLFMLAPGLGLFRAATNQAGEILITEERIRQAMDSSAGNHRELTRLLRLALGQAWDDVLEPFRAARYNDNLELITRAV